jgi:hypothetical protein
MPETPAIFKDDFPKLADKQTQWRAFHRRMGLAADAEFPAVIAAIRDFLLPVYHALYRQEVFTGNWKSISHSWC